MTIFLTLFDFCLIFSFNLNLIDKEGEKSKDKEREREKDKDKDRESKAQRGSRARASTNTVTTTTTNTSSSSSSQSSLLQDEILSRNTTAVLNSPYKVGQKVLVDGGKNLLWDARIMELRAGKYELCCPYILISEMTSCFCAWAWILEYFVHFIVPILHCFCLNWCTVLFVAPSVIYIPDPISHNVLLIYDN